MPIENKYVVVLILLIRTINYKINCENSDHHELLSNINKFLLICPGVGFFLIFDALMDFGMI